MTALADCIVTDRYRVERDTAGRALEGLGGKAFNLLRLRAGGFRVPSFVVVTSQAFQEVVARDAEVGGLVAKLEGASLSELAELSAGLQRRVQAIGCPPQLLRDLRRALGQLAGPRASWAVRSSAPSEDGDRHSFAGLLESRLNVHEHELGDAVVAVWASAFSARCLAYRSRKGLGFRGLSTAVVVQEMVEAKAAGVLFSADPAAPAGNARGPRMLVVAGCGLGEGVVQGTVGIDAYRVGRTENAVERNLGEKDEAIAPAAAGGTYRRRLPPSARQASVLEDAHIYSLRDLALVVEGEIGGPVDLEWALDEAGRLHLLQARPIAPPAHEGEAAHGRTEPVREDDRRIWDNSNVVESYPGLTLPLTFSFVRTAYERAFRRAARRFFPIVNPLAGEPQLFASLVGLVQGRVYYNLLNWYAMYAWLARPERHRESWDRLIGIRTAGPETKRTTGLRARAIRAQAGLSAAVIVLQVGSLGRRFRARFQDFLERHRDAGREATAILLAARYRRVDDDASAFWHLTLFNDLCALRYHEWLAALCRRWAPEDPDLAARLLTVEDDLQSVAPLRSLLEIAAAIRRNPAWLALFAETDDGLAWHRIEREPGLAPLRETLATHVERFGDRAMAELKLESPTFREEPARLLPLLRGYLRQGLAPDSLDERRAERLRQAETALQRVPGPLRRLSLRLLAARARTALANREEMRLARARLFGIVRRILRRIGERLVTAGALSTVEDVFHLSIEEVLSYAEGTTVTRDLGALVALRRGEYAALTGRDLPTRLATRGIPSLDQTATAAGVVEDPRTETARSLRGVGCSSGTVSAPARVMLDPTTTTPEPGGILVARSTDPGWAFVMMSAAGLVAEQGSPLSHTALVARELGIPAVVGVEGATQRIPDGASLTVDGRTGEVVWRSRSSR